MAGHRPQDWPDNAPPAASQFHQAITYLSSERVLNDEAAQAIHSFYTFMLGEVNATAVAEQLVAEEADEAAKAAARKAKKQKAKARKQQARSDAAAASEPSAKTSMQSEQDVEHTATVPQSSPSASRGGGSLSDQDTVGPQSQLQHKIAQDSAVYALPDQATLDEPRVASAAVAVGSPSTGAAAVEASQGADATFLDQLFCCPLTKVAMVDPVIAGDGHTYERSAIQHWLQGSSLSPVTRDKLPHTRLVPNVLVKSALAQHAGLS
ncbi:hypothetical protein ABBQ32_009644 [Trebouxia sp. C0010 RCD-2024]